MEKDFSQIKISSEQAAEILERLYEIKGEITQLDGEFDFNFKVKAEEKKYILKISRPGTDQAYIDFQHQLLQYAKKNNPSISIPETIPDKSGNFIGELKDENGDFRIVRLLSWMDGRLWSSVNPIKEALLYSLGEKAGGLTEALIGFEHPYAKRDFKWDTAQGEWVSESLHLFSDEQGKIVQYFMNCFKENKASYEGLRKNVIHNDVNDNNIVVSDDLLNPEVFSIIDYGDAIETWIINDLANTLAYAVMNKPDPLRAAIPVIKGYHKSFPLEAEELNLLYFLVAMRLVISVTTSAINKSKEPDNTYLLISEKPAWDLLRKWVKIDPDFAYYTFRDACGLKPHPKEDYFLDWARKQSISPHELFPRLKFNQIHPVDISVGSIFVGHQREFQDNRLFSLKIDRLQYENPDSLIAGGYLEKRSVYTNKNYKREGNSGYEYRSVHLGIDFWVKPETPVHSVLDGKVVSIFDNGNDLDYGPTLILEHQADDLCFYTLYGHLSRNSLDLLKPGEDVKKGDLIAYIGDIHENGSWAGHLHFQIMLDRLGYEHDFPGVAFPDEAEVWKSVCPDPNFLFKNRELEGINQRSDTDIIKYRKNHLGKSLSLAYDEPLKILRGSGVYLIDESGRKYLDTVNNVAHVGHEHPRVVKAGQQQMGVLNTNSRYLHENINDFAKELLSTFPDSLSVVHFVNSGSEANELAMRMTKAASGRKDMIAVEVGYHGNTNGCIEISSYKFDGKGGKGSPEHTHIVPLPDAFRGMYQGENTGERYASHIKDQIEIIQSKGREPAGFICESIVSCGGQTELPGGYLKRAYQYVRDAGGICIADEVQVGVGRVGRHFWGFQLHDVVPDIVTIGKPIGNGHPLAAVVCTQAVAEAFANGMEYFNTFGGNPVSCAIGREVLRVVKDEKLQENALETGNYLKEKLSVLQKDFPIIGHVRGQGLFLGFELVDADKNPLTDKVTYLANRMKELGILMSIDGRDNNVLKIKPPVVFSKENADQLILRLESVFMEDYMQK